MIHVLLIRIIWNILGTIRESREPWVILFYLEFPKLICKRNCVTVNFIESGPHNVNARLDLKSNTLFQSSLFSDALASLALIIVTH